MVSRFESAMSEYIGDDLVGHVSELVNISIEALIAELVDNSLDKKATKIHVEISGSNTSSLTFEVYDNSPIGFKSEQELDQSFRVAGKKEREDDEIGSFHMGMKISTTSKFNDVSAFTVIGSEIKHRRINHQHTMSSQYEPLEDIVFPRADEVRKELNSGNWTTAICLHNPPSPLFGKAGEITVKHRKGFSRQVSTFFGITYENTLRNRPDIEMTINSEKVKPLDPFWREFTPAKIEERLAIPRGRPGHVAYPRQRLALENSIPWGTIATTSMMLPVQFNGSEHQIKVQGFVIPYGNVRKKLHSNDLTEGVFVEKPSDAGTKTLNAQFLSGFFFYRNDRCIAFGKTGQNSNGGWYNYGEPGDNQKLGVRFRIEFPSELDKYMRVSPTKSTVLPVENFYKVIQAAWDQTIDEPKLRKKLGDGKRPFFKKTDQNKTVVGAATSSANNSNAWDDDCIHCGGFHVKNTVCKFAPCAICGSKSTCKSGCEYVCKHCKTVGQHISKNCPLNCALCGKGGGHPEGEICPAASPDPDKPGNTEEITQGESGIEPQPENALVELYMYKKNKQENIQHINEAMEFLGITKDEL